MRDLDTAPDALARDIREVGDVVVADTDVGRLLLHADDRVMTPLIQQNRTWEAPEGHFLREAIRPGATVVDVGANVGYMTLLAARAAGPGGSIVAVEPEPANVALLRANLWLNEVDNVTVLPVAAWSRREQMPLWFNPHNRGDHRIGIPTATGPPVPAVPLDELLDGLVLDVVKVDTQGADHEALVGMSTALSRSPRVAVLTEFWLDGLEERGAPPAEVLGRYREMGFAVALLQDDGREVPASDRQIVEACEAWQGRFVNLVLRPAGAAPPPGG